MKIPAFVLLLSLLANLSFASFSDDTLTLQSSIENMDTVCRDGSRVCLVGEWTNIGQSQLSAGFSSLSLFANGKFEITDSDGQQVCGNWELSADGLFMALHKICEETGEKTGTVIAQIELADGHMLTLGMPSGQGGKQTFIQ